MAVNAQADAQLRSVQLAPPAHFEACHCRYPARIGKEKGSTLYKPEISTGPTNNYQLESVMETWYRTGGYADNIIEPVAVVKSTAKTVTVKEVNWNGRELESRSAIQSDYYQYFRTWDEAYAHALSRAEMKVNQARNALEKANGHLGNVRGLKKPA